MIMPVSHINVPAIKNPIDCSLFFDVRATIAANKVKNTHIPCRVHVIRKLRKEVLIVTNLVSSPARITLRNKNELKRNAQVITITNKNMSWAVNPELEDFQNNANEIAVIYVRPPVKSKNRSVWNRYAGINAIH